jgi:hypothetical protein
MVETDLYEPVKSYFTSLGYAVNAEVKGCDMTAVKEDELVIVELKLHFNITLLCQALERQRLTEIVYAAVPRPKRMDKNSKAMLEIARRMRMGLILVALDSPAKGVQVVVEVPGKSNDTKTHTRRSGMKREAVLNEANGRTSDMNKGGSAKIKINTVYREKCLKVACMLASSGPLTAALLVKRFGCDKGANAIMRNNYYGWFEPQKERGFYGLSFEGRKFLEENSQDDLVLYYMEAAATATQEALENGMNAPEGS